MAVVVTIVIVMAVPVVVAVPMVAIVSMILMIIAMRVTAAMVKVAILRFHEEAPTRQLCPIAVRDQATGGIGPEVERRDSGFDGGPMLGKRVQQGGHEHVARPSSERVQMNVQPQLRRTTTFDVRQRLTRGAGSPARHREGQGASPRTMRDSKDEREDIRCRSTRTTWPPCPRRCRRG